MFRDPLGYPRPKQTGPYSEPGFLTIRTRGKDFNTPPPIPQVWPPAMISTTPCQPQARAKYPAMPIGRCSVKAGPARPSARRAELAAQRWRKAKQGPDDELVGSSQAHERLKGNSAHAF